MRIINDHVGTKKFLEDKLLGGQLDCFHVSNVELNLSFFCDSETGKRLCWISTMGRVSVSNNSNFYEDRSNVVSWLHGLIGEKISSVEIEHDGNLEIWLGSTALNIGMDEGNFEVIWSVTPDSPEQYIEHDWAVELTDEPALVLFSKD